MNYLLAALCLLGILTWSGIRVVEARHQAVAAGYEMAREVERKEALTEELRRLRIDRATLLSPEALERVAREAGLRVPQPDQVVVLAEAPPAPAAQPFADQPSAGGARED